MKKALKLFLLWTCYCVWMGWCCGSLPAAHGGDVAQSAAGKRQPDASRHPQQTSSQPLSEPTPVHGGPNVPAEIVAIGDELCYGKVYDTNSFWIADQITRRGVLVQRIVCVRDDLSDICSVVKDALSRKPRFIFITGGLGHTDDDRTRAALSAVTGRKIIGRPDILEFIARRRSVSVEQLPPHFKISTSSLEGAKCLPNPAGVSPVTILDEGPTQIIAMPGPPREVYACFAEHLADTIQKATGYHSFSRRVIIPMHESELTPLMSKVMREIPGTYVKALVGAYKSDPGMPIEVMAFGPTGERCKDACSKAVERLRRLAADRGRRTIEVPEEIR